LEEEEKPAEEPVEAPTEEEKPAEEPEADVKEPEVSGESEELKQLKKELAEIKESINEPESRVTQELSVKDSIFDQTHSSGVQEMASYLQKNFSE